MAPVPAADDDGMVEVRVTMFPDDPIRVPAGEVHHLRTSGILHEPGKSGRRGTAPATAQPGQTPEE